MRIEDVEFLKYQNFPTHNSTILIKQTFIPCMWKSVWMWISNFHFSPLAAASKIHQNKLRSTSKRVRLRVADLHEASRELCSEFNRGYESAHIHHSFRLRAEFHHRIGKRGEYISWTLEQLRLTVQQTLHFKVKEAKNSCWIIDEFSLALLFALCHTTTS